MEKDFLDGKIAYTFTSEEDVSDFLEKWYIYNPEPRNDERKYMLKDIVSDMGKYSIVAQGKFLYWNQSKVQSVTYRSNNYIVELL